MSNANVRLADSLFHHFPPAIEDIPDPVPHADLPDAGAYPPLVPCQGDVLVFPDLQRKCIYVNLDKDKTYLSSNLLSDTGRGPGSQTIKVKLFTPATRWIKKYTESFKKDGVMNHSNLRLSRIMFLSMTPLS